MQDEIDPVTIDEACAIIGGKAKPIDRATYYRGVKAGRYPAGGRSPALVKPRRSMKESA